MPRRQPPLLEALTRAGFRRLDDDDIRSHRDFPTWEKDGARASFAQELLGVWKGKVTRFSGDSGEMSIQALFVDEDKRGQGKASEMLDIFVQVADEQSYTLYLEPVPIGPGQRLSLDELKAFYRSRGFCETDESGRVMSRPPAEKEELHHREEEAPRMAG